MEFTHQYHLKVIKKVNKNEEKRIKTLVIDFSPFFTAHVRYINFTDPSKDEKQHALQIKFRKSSYEIKVMQNSASYILRTNALSAAILTRGEIIDYDQHEYCTEPIVEFLIKENDLKTLEELRDTFLNYNLPSERCFCMDCFIGVPNGCLESEEQTPERTTFTINSSDGSSKLAPWYCCQ